MIVEVTQKQLEEIFNSNISTQTKKSIKNKVDKRLKKLQKKLHNDQVKYLSDLELRGLAERFRNDLIRKQTEAEKVFKAILKSLHVEYEFQKVFFTNNSFYIVDFYIPNKNTVFEIDGGYHFNIEQRKLDSRRTTILKNKGIFQVYRFTNKDVIESNTSTSSRIQKLLTL
jgi:very-short-patch-repair endonuclease